VNRYEVTRVDEHPVKERLELQDESKSIGKTHVPQLQSGEAQACGARDLQRPAP
jgi:glutaredoxin